MLKNLSGKKEPKGAIKHEGPKPKARDFLSLRKHVAIGQGLVATHAHDERLQVRPKWADLSLKEKFSVLTFEPVRSTLMQKVDKSKFIATSECVASLILPSDVHGGWGQVVIPRVPDVLTDAVQKVVHREGFKAMSIEKYIVCEQSSFLHHIQGWCDLTCC